MASQRRTVGTYRLGSLAKSAPYRVDRRLTATEGRRELGLGHLEPPAYVVSLGLLVHLVPSRPPLPERERKPPRRPDEGSFVEVREDRADSPALARSLLTVPDAISLASFAGRAHSSRPSLMCSYCRFRLSLQVIGA
jgi:hypothetical protein